MRWAGFSTRLVSFGALLAFVWQVLAMAGGMSGQPTSWAEACTPAGIVKVALTDDSASADAAAGSVDCTWCQLMAGAAEPGPMPALVPRRPASRSVLVVRAQAPHPSHTPWSGLPIRAPPAAA
jgi:Protein of unknown function (DUF2946)